MIIIIEGIDRVGKTTLAKLINKKFNIPIYKQERIGGNEIQLNVSCRNNGRLMKSSNLLMNYTRARTLVDFWNWSGYKQDIILDRFHWTEAVYSLVDRHSPDVMQMMENVEREMLNQKDKYFIIQVMPVEIKWSSREHGSDLTRHQKEFDKLYDKSELNKYRCTFYSYDLVLNEIERRLKICRDQEN